MPYTTAVTFAIANVLTIVTRVLKPLPPGDKLQVLQHLLDAIGSLHANIDRHADSKGT
jgi:hypothetical protein